MKMDNVKTVTKWELNKNFRSTGFILMTILIPVLILVGSLIPMLFMDNVTADPKTVAVLDTTPDYSFGPLFSGLEANDTKYELFTDSQEELRERVLAGEFDGGLVFDEDNLARGVIPLFLHDMDLERRAQSQVGSIVYSLVTQSKLNQLGLSQEELAFLAEPVNLQVVSPDAEVPLNGEGEEGERAGEGHFMPTAVFDSVLPLLAGVLLFVSVLILGQILMYGVIKEKKNRIVEILLSSLSATELLWGKIISFGLLSMTQILIWTVTGLFAATRIMKVTLPLESAAETLIPLTLYFILGYLMLSSLFAVLGAIMKDAESGSQVQGMLILVPMFPIFLATPIMMSPDAAWISVVSFIPIFTPGMMLLRTGITDVPLWEIVGTLAVLAVSVVVTIKLSAKIFEGSILQVDTATSLKDMKNMLSRKKGLQES